MSVKYRRPEVTQLSEIWLAIRAVIRGPKAIRDGGILYLPKPSPEDKSAENQARYLNYKKRAIFYDATSRTHTGMIGQIFYRDPVISIPSGLEIMMESVDGGELTLEQQSKESCGTVLALGHAGLLTDYPTVEGPITLLDQLEGKVRPTIILYQPEQIINWRWSTLGTKRYLSLVVLEEGYDIEDDGYEVKRGTQWREMRIELTDTGKPMLHIKIHREGENGLEVVADYFPRMGNGANWDRIPFSFMGSDNNEPAPDKPPFEGMAELNLGHYRNSADYEDSCHMVGQPTPWGSGLTEDWVKDVWKGEVVLGSRAFLPLPEGGQAGLLQAEANIMPKEAMEMKERQMVALGAKLVEQQQVQRTATEAMGENIVENSVLATVAKNVSAAYIKAFEFAMEYSGITGPIEFELNTDFEISRMSTQERQQLLLEWQGGGITWTEYRWNIKRTGVAFEEDNVAKSAIEADMEAALKLEGGEEENTGGNE